MPSGNRRPDQNYSDDYYDNFKKGGNFRPTENRIMIFKQPDAKKIFNKKPSEIREGNCP